MSGLLTGRTVLAHGVWLDDAELALVADRGATIVTNPSSNMKLTVGRVFPYPAAHRAGIPIGIGTDGVASNNSLDLLAEVKQLALLQKHASGDPALLPASEAWAIATGAAAPFLGGSPIAVGAPADFSLVHATAIELVPGATGRRARVLGRERGHRDGRDRRPGGDGGPADPRRGRGDRACARMRRPHPGRLSHPRGRIMTDIPLPDLSTAYRGVREHVGVLLRGATQDQLQATAPATPAWRVHDVLSHVVGITTDVLEGRVDGVATDAWTEAQVAARRGYRPRRCWPSGTPTHPRSNR